MRCWLATAAPPTAIPATEPDDRREHRAFLSEPALDRIAAAASGPPDQVMVMDCMRAIFPRDPFLTKTIGLSVFCEGPTRICDSDYNLDRLAFFVPPEVSSVPLPVVSSTLFAEHCRWCANSIIATVPGDRWRARAAQHPQGGPGRGEQAVPSRRSGFPVIVHPNGAEVYFDFWPSGLAVDTRHGVRIGGTVPGVVLAGDPILP